MGYGGGGGGGVDLADMQSLSRKGIKYLLCKWY